MALPHRTGPVVGSRRSSWRRGLSARASLLLASCAAAGCYASHGVERAGELCELDDVTGSPCGAAGPAVAPDGVCALADGSLIAFRDFGWNTDCSDEPGDAVFALRPRHCMSEGPTRRHVRLCGEASPEVSFAVDARPPFRSALFDLSESECALFDPPGRRADGPWERLPATQLCDDPLAWCGAPIVLELRQPGGDPCGGSSFIQRCRARVVGDSIVLDAETAPAVWTACETELADRVARCIVPPLPSGPHEVLDASGRRLGTIDVPASQPAGDREPTCRAIL
jgi:hypothetical protein